MWSIVAALSGGVNSDDPGAVPACLGTGAAPAFPRDPITINTEQ